MAGYAGWWLAGWFELKFEQSHSNIIASSLQAATRARSYSSRNTVPHRPGPQSVSRGRRDHVKLSTSTACSGMFDLLHVCMRPSEPREYRETNREQGQAGSACMPHAGGDACTLQPRVSVNKCSGTRTSIQVFEYVHWLVLSHHDLQGRARSLNRGHKWSFARMTIHFSLGSVRARARWVKLSLSLWPRQHALCTKKKHVNLGRVLLERSLRKTLFSKQNGMFRARCGCVGT